MLQCSIPAAPYLNRNKNRGFWCVCVCVGVRACVGGVRGAVEGVVEIREREKSICH